MEIAVLQWESSTGIRMCVSLHMSIPAVEKENCQHSYSTCMLREATCFCNICLKQRLRVFLDFLFSPK